jgi:phospholipid-binding lipoprotein MlaA
MSKKIISMALAGLCSAALLCGCAEKIDNADGRAYDPYEETNRDVYNFNTYLDKTALRPVAVTYRDDVPQPVQTGVHNVLNNLNTPYVFANELLQGDVTEAGETLGRLLLNSTMGLAGFLDVGTKAGLDAKTTGFGHTLAVYGVGHGPYLVLPLIGPSTPREAIGYGADAASDPIDYFIPFYGSVLEGATGLVDQRSRYIDQIDELRQSSLDEYATVRSIYLQQLEASDREQGGSGGPMADIPDYTDPATGTTK